MRYPDIEKYNARDEKIQGWINQKVGNLEMRIILSLFAVFSLAGSGILYYSGCDSRFVSGSLFILGLTLGFATLVGTLGFEYK